MHSSYGNLPFPFAGAVTMKGGRRGIALDESLIRTGLFSLPVGASTARRPPETRFHPNGSSRRNGTRGNGAGFGIGTHQSPCVRRGGEAALRRPLCLSSRSCLSVAAVLRVVWVYMRNYAEFCPFLTYFVQDSAKRRSPGCESAAEARSNSRNKVHQTWNHLLADLSK